MDHIYGFLLQVHSDLLSGISEITGPGYGRITSGLDESIPITYAAEPFVCRLILVKGAMGLIQKFRFHHHRELKTSVTHQKKCREHEDPTELTFRLVKLPEISLRLWIATSQKYQLCRPRFFNIKAPQEIRNTTSPIQRSPWIWMEPYSEDGILCAVDSVRVLTSLTQSP